MMLKAQKSTLNSIDEWSLNFLCRQIKLEIFAWAMILASVSCKQNSAFCVVIFISELKEKTYFNLVHAELAASGKQKMWS